MASVEQLVSAHANFLQQLMAKNWHTPANLIQTVIPFAVMKPYQLPPDQKISSIWVR
jgi:hypothetical protein